MKIFYAIQATGNGHIARAIELMPYLKQYGTVDVFLSGSNSSLPVDLPVRFKSKGISLHYAHKDEIDYTKMPAEFSDPRILKEAKDLPVEKYDCVLIDFEGISALSCKLKKIYCIGFGHHASFQSLKTPRPTQKNIKEEWALKYYAPTSDYLGLHFKEYDSFIFNPVIKSTILKTEPEDKQHITVYLHYYTDEFLMKHLKKLPDFQFHIFSATAKKSFAEENITIIPVDNKAFNKSVTNCHGIITGAGFETPSEALYLGKKLMCIPVAGHYEQLCNAAALKKDFNVPFIEGINETFSEIVLNWLEQPPPKPLKLKYTTEEIVHHVMKLALQLS